MEYPSTWKATRVAIPVAAIIGTISPKPLWVSSSTRAKPDSGACIDAPIMAAAQTMANAPDGEPGQARFQAMPNGRQRPEVADYVSVIAGLEGEIIAFIRNAGGATGTLDP